MKQAIKSIFDAAILLASVLAFYLLETLYLGLADFNALRLGFRLVLTCAMWITLSLYLNLVRPKQARTYERIKASHWAAWRKMFTIGGLYSLLGFTGGIWMFFFFILAIGPWDLQIPASESFAFVRILIPVMPAMALFFGAAGVIGYVVMEKRRAGEA